MRNYHKRKGELFNKFNLSILLIILSAIFIYRKAFVGYFQGDEWYYFASYFSTLNENFGDLKLIFGTFLNPRLFGGHFTPALQPISYLQIKLFGINFILYQFLSLFLHSLISVFVFYFAYLISKKNIFFALVAGLFFALNSVHSQAVSWIAAVGVQISLLFSILSLVCLELFFLKNRKKFKNLSLVFFILAILSKETSIILFFIYPLMTYFRFRSLKKTLNFLKFSLFVVLAYSLTVVIYGWYVYQLALAVGSRVTYSPFALNIFDFNIIYKIFTWTLKSVSQIFFPSDFIYFMGEKVTVWGFPFYAQEASVRGFNYLTFSQSAGAEFFLYFSSIIILFLIYKVYKFFKKDLGIRKSIILAMVFIIFSVIPFLFIASSLTNLFGYVTTLDSRHVYTMSVGGGLLFASFITSIFRRGNKVTALLILLLWGVLSNYSVNQVLDRYAFVADQRKLISNTILKEVPRLNKDSVFFVESNTAYYGFGLMPPFQTNLGQILSVLYYNNKQLPDYFMKSNFLAKKGILGEGYVENEGRGFGYYNDESHLLSQAGKNSFFPDDIFAFYWDGKINKVSNITKKIREKFVKRLSLVSKYENWGGFFDYENKFSFLYYPGMNFVNFTELTSSKNPDILDDVAIATGDIFDNTIPNDYDGLYIRITVRKKPEGINFGNLVSLLSDSDGQVIGNNYTFRYIKNINGTGTTALVPLTGTYPKYLFLYDNKLFFEFSVMGRNFVRIFLPDGQEDYYEEIENIIATIDDYNYEK